VRCTASCCRSACTLCVGLLFFYEINKQTEVRIEVDLAARRPI
jgi:hypothetical protein